MFPRKILPKIHFLCVLALVRSQNYEYSSDEGDTESDIEGDSHPDYSKYYSVTPKEGTIALASFAQPQQHFGFGFGPFEAAFGASSQEKQKLIPTQAFVPIQAKPVAEAPASFSDFFNKNLFGINQPASPTDYFEQSQPRQREEAREEPSENVSEEKENEEENEEAEEQSEYNQSGPSYISHDVPAKIPHQVETVKVQGAGLNLISPPAKVHDLRDYKDHHKYLPYVQQTVTPQVYPQAPGYQKFTQPSASPKLTPYQRFSFQPVADYQNKYLENLNSESSIRPNYRAQYARVNVPSYVSQESKVVPRAADRKNCKKLTKDSGNGKIGDLTCYVCENQENNSKVTECSYQSDPASTDLHKGSSERYSVPAKRPDGFRYRRYASEEDSDPYEYVKNRSLRAENEKQEEGDNYEYEGYDASQPEKSYSEVQSEEILKDPKKCTNVERDGMSCKVCKDPATGGNYESCSFSTAPEPEKYAYVSEKKYNSNDDPDYASKGDESKNVPTNTKATDDDESVEDQKPKKARKPRKKYSKNVEETSPKSSKSEYSDYVHPKNLERKSWEEPSSSKGEKSYYPKYEAESRQESRSAKNEDEEEDDTKSNSESAEEDVSPYKEIGEYKFKYFPEFSGEESRVKEEPIEYVSTNKKEVEDVLADFKKKDRSQCKQVKKNGMTCYLCVDENRVKNEECMFSSESKPKGTYAKYTKTDEASASSEVKPVTTKKSAGGRKKRSQRKANEISGASSSKIESVVSAPSGEKQVPEETELKASASAQDAQRIEEKEDESKLDTPHEIDTTDEGGLYSAETKPVYSKALGMTLPKYMLDKSEFEKEFDALLPH